MTDKLLKAKLNYLPPCSSSNFDYLCFITFSKKFIRIIVVGIQNLYLNFRKITHCFELLDYQVIIWVQTFIIKRNNDFF